MSHCGWGSKIRPMLAYRMTATTAVYEVALKRRVAAFSKRMHTVSQAVVFPLAHLPPRTAPITRRRLRCRRRAPQNKCCRSRISRAISRALHGRIRRGIEDLFFAALAWQRVAKKSHGMPCTHGTRKLWSAQRIVGCKMERERFSAQWLHGCLLSCPLLHRYARVRRDAC